MDAGYKGIYAITELGKKRRGIINDMPDDNDARTMKLGCRSRWID